MLFTTDSDLLVGAADLDHIERRSGRYAKSLALANREIVNATVLADHVAVCGHQIAGSVGQSLALLREISIDKPLVVAPGNEANLLRVRLLCQRKAMLAGEIADLRLHHVAERENGAAQLLLGQAE